MAGRKTANAPVPEGRLLFRDGQLLERLRENIDADIMRDRCAHRLYNDGIGQVNDFPKRLLLEELTYLGSECGKLGRELHSFCNSPGVVSDDFLRRLWLWDGVFPLDFLLERDDVIPFVSERLVARVVRCQR